MNNDGNAIAEALVAVLADNHSILAEYRSGKTKVYGFLMGRIMKKLGGTGNPDMVKTALENALNNGD